MISDVSCVLKETKNSTVINTKQIVLQNSSTIKRLAKAKLTIGAKVDLFLVVAMVVLM